MERTVLSVHGLTGGYSRKRPVLKDVSVEVRRGELVGLLGLNGAGKSTFMKHVIGLLTPHEGSVAVLGRTFEQSAESYRSSYTFVPESPSLYEELTVWEHLEWTALAYRMEEGMFRRRAEALLKTFRMADERSKFARHLSKGMRQKVMIMCAFLVRPPLYVIDEPFLGLDPLAIHALLEEMRAEKEHGSALVVSSHILSMLETYCDRYIVLHQGRIVAQGTMEEVIRAAGTSPEGRIEAAFFRLVGGGER